MVASKTETEPTLKRSSFLDRFFIALTATGFAGGTVLAFLPVYPAIPATFLGTAISALVYHFMGGIKPDEPMVVNGAKLSGTLAALITTISFLNGTFEKQINIKFQPSESEIVTLNRNSGKPEKVTLEVNNIQKTLSPPTGWSLRGVHLSAEQQGSTSNIAIKNSDFDVGSLNEQDDLNPLGYYNINQPAVVEAISNLKRKDDPSSYSNPVLVSLRNLCREGRGPCEAPYVDLLVSVPGDIRQGHAAVCETDLDLLNQDLLVTNASGKAAVIVKADSSFLNNPICLEDNPQRHLVQISAIDQTKLKLDQNGFARAKVVPANLRRTGPTQAAKPGTPDS
jgi:hypothetical protein